jgi:hypothetical protein
MISIHPKLKQALLAFEEAGIKLSAEEIAWLAVLRHKCDEEENSEWIEDAPLVVNDVKFYPLHRLAMRWLLHIYPQMKLPHLQVACYLFAHIHSAPGDETLRNLFQYSNALKAICDWYASASFTNEQMLQIVQRLRVIDCDVEVIPDPDAKNFGETSDVPHATHRITYLLCSCYPGVPPDFWDTRISEKRAMELLRVALNKKDDEFATSQKRKIAIENWLKALRWIWKLHAEEVQSEQRTDISVACT